MSPSEYTPPILAEKHFESASTFTPESLLHEARRQKGALVSAVPKVCLLDPDGDIVRQLRADGRAWRHEGWVCYHTELFVFEEDELTVGVIGRAVGASFSVLVAEELFASGCELLISITSSRQITSVQEPPYFIRIDRALRDEGTSYHYLPPTDWSYAPTALLLTNQLGQSEGDFEKGEGEGSVDALKVVVRTATALGWIPGSRT